MANVKGKDFLFGDSLRTILEFNQKVLNKAIIAVEGKRKKVSIIKRSIKGTSGIKANLIFEDGNFHIITDLDKEGTLITRLNNESDLEYSKRATYRYINMLYRNIYKGIDEALGFC